MCECGHYAKYHDSYGCWAALYENVPTCMCRGYKKAKRTKSE